MKLLTCRLHSPAAWKALQYDGLKQIHMHLLIQRNKAVKHDLWDFERQNDCELMQYIITNRIVAHRVIITTGSGFSPTAIWAIFIFACGRPILSKKPVSIIILCADVTSVVICSKKYRIYDLNEDFSFYLMTCKNCVHPLQFILDQIILILNYKRIQHTQQKYSNI